MYSASHTASDQSDDAFDPSRIFIGREQQLDLFCFYLDRWQHDMLTAPDVQMTTAPSPNNRIQGIIVLLYGHGGFGKSTLLKHYRDIALERTPKLNVSDILDWEFDSEGKRSLFNPPPGQEIDAPEYFASCRADWPLPSTNVLTSFEITRQPSGL